MLMFKMININKQIFLIIIKIKNIIYINLIDNYYKKMLIEYQWQQYHIPNMNQKHLENQMKHS